MSRFLQGTRVYKDTPEVVFHRSDRFQYAEEGPPGEFVLSRQESQEGGVPPQEALQEGADQDQGSVAINNQENDNENG